MLCRYWTSYSKISSQDNLKSVSVEVKFAQLSLEANITETVSENTWVMPGVYHSSTAWSLPVSLTSMLM